MTDLKRIFSDRSGVTLVEFALTAPVFLVLMFGLFEVGHTIYIQSILNGAMQEAGRDSSIQGAKILDIQDEIQNSVRRIAPEADLTFKRESYQEYRTINRLELFLDANGDGTCNDGEIFEDLNDSGEHDYVLGEKEVGDANNIVVFQASVNYKRLFPMPSLVGWSDRNVIIGTTLLRNQPFREKPRKKNIGYCK